MLTAIRETFTGISYRNAMGQARFFTSQFSEDNDGVVFRDSGTGRAYRITFSERDQMIAIYSRLTNRNGLLMVAPIFVAYGFSRLMGLLPQRVVIALIIIDAVFFIPVLCWGNWANASARTKAMDVLGSRPSFPSIY
ncbi:hypothetical protein [Sphingomonas sp. CROZ-RG-20F-R02-07]|uniref:hypothetical protein n=1 Tax=Sphingomonas sp. CROZ-RG-20F-R02-07 TaxID=2914832 RepID=UPI001F58819D|nr:hypothetical protein [Sphingomonas sp. CROZ-RG-20F-R02-07]